MLVKDVQNQLAKSFTTVFDDADGKPKEVAS
jgi:hypothetical protein